MAATQLTVDPLALALISACGGALVSSLITVFNQTMERRSKRKEIIFTTAIAQAKQRVSTVMEIMKQTGKSGVVPDETILAGTYYSWLQELFDNGRLPKEAIEAEKQSQRELEEAEKLRKERNQLNNDRIVEDAAKHPLKARQLLANTNLALFSESQLNRLQETAAGPYP